MQRLIKAIKILEKDHVNIILKDESMVQLQVFSNKYKDYVVTWNYTTFHCTCDDYQHRHSTCKHIIASILYLYNQRKEGQVNFDETFSKSFNGELRT